MISSSKELLSVFEVQLLHISLTELRRRWRKIAIWRKEFWCKLVGEKNFKEPAFTTSTSSEDKGTKGSEVRKETYSTYIYKGL